MEVLVLLKATNYSGSNSDVEYCLDTVSSIGSFLVLTISNVLWFEHLPQRSFCCQYCLWWLVIYFTLCYSWGMLILCKLTVVSLDLANLVNIITGWLWNSLQACVVAVRCRDTSGPVILSTTSNWDCWYRTLLHCLRPYNFLFVLSCDMFVSHLLLSLDFIVMLSSHSEYIFVPFYSHFFKNKSLSEVCNNIFCLVVYATKISGIV
jgi:hypothetical protein